jgi:hypothetical protein
MKPERALEIVRNMRPKEELADEDGYEIKILEDIRDGILQKIEMLQYEANGIERAILILRST